MLFSAEPPVSRIQRRAAEILAADPDAAKFFGGRVTAVGIGEFAFPLKAPALLLLASKCEPVPRPGGQHNLDVTLIARAILPHPTPATSFLPRPAAPSVADTGTSITYRITQCSPAGESWASDPVTSSGITTLTLPALSSGCNAFRIWRSLAGRTACGWVGESWASGTWEDPGDSPNDELAPTFGLEHTVRGLIESALRKHSSDLDMLPDGDVFLARLLRIGRFLPGPSRTNQLWCDLELIYPTTYNPETQEIAVYR